MEILIEFFRRLFYNIFPTKTLDFSVGFCIFASFYSRPRVLMMKIFSCAPVL